VRLLSARASAGLRRRELMRAAVPSLAPNLCACLVCVALWAWALEAQRAQDAPVQALARGLEETLRSARALALGEEQMGSAGGVGMAQELGELSRSAAELARAETPEQQLEALEALEAELSELSREGAGDRALAEQLAAAESWGGALRAALARDEAGSPGPGQTPPAPDGTMSGSPPSSARPGGHPGQTDALPVASSTGPGEPGAGAAQEGGAGAAPTWPPRFDPLVERWIQIASADTPPDPQPPEHP